MTTDTSEYPETLSFFINLAHTMRAEEVVSLGPPPITGENIKISEEMNGMQKALINLIAYCQKKQQELLKVALESQHFQPGKTSKEEKEFDSLHRKIELAEDILLRSISTW